MAKPTTATGVDIFNALNKRLLNQGHILSEPQLLSLTVDVMTVISTDSANAIAHAATETSANPVRPFIRPV